MASKIKIEFDKKVLDDALRSLAAKLSIDPKKATRNLQKLFKDMKSKPKPLVTPFEQMQKDFLGE